MHKYLYLVFAASGVLFCPDCVLAGTESVRMDVLLPEEMRTVSSGQEMDALLPEALRTVTPEQDVAALESLALKINQLVTSPAQPAQESITDALNVPFVDELLDENGALDLPMGITVFNTMGDFSIGFGSDF
jgi:hypothetical protein